ncbi:MAG: secretion protein HlyD [Proteobacteria bacterium]|nr:secretion protein HlyD [Pseudomonadota bacterium]
MIYLKKNRRRFIRMGIIFLVIIGVIFLGVTLWRHNHAQNRLVLYGNVDIRQADLGFRVSGRIQEMRFEEGDVIKTGDVVAILDKAPYEADLAAARAELAQAEANFAKFQHGSRPQEIEEARATVHERQATLDNATTIFIRQKEQIKVDGTSRQDYDTALATKLEAEALLKNAEEALSLAEEGFRKEDIEAAQAAMETAKAHLQSAEINLKDTEILSPAEGVMLTRVNEPGEIVTPQSVVYTLSLNKPVWIRAYVAEPHLGDLKPGMEASVITDAHPDAPFKGQIGFISPQAEFTPKTVETPELRTDLVYRLRILVDDPKGQLRQGMPVTLHIKLLP